MVTLTINRKPQGIFSKSPATPLQDKTNTAHNVKAISALLMCVNGRWRPLRSEGAAVRGSDTTGTERGRGPANGAE